MARRCAGVMLVLRTVLGGVCPWYAGPRADCGYYGIDEAECLARNCCWRPTTHEREPWCFFKVETLCPQAQPRRACKTAGPTEDECRRQGCCWAAQEGSMEARDTGPACFRGASHLKGYVVQSVEERAYGVHLVLHTTPDTQSSYGTLLSPLEVDIYYETRQRVHMKITHPSCPPWEVPQSVTPTPPLPLTAPPTMDYVVTYAPVGHLFWVTVCRGDGQVLFSTKGQHFEATVQYWEIGTVLPPDTSLYGLGERLWGFRLTPGTYTLFNHDSPSPPHSNLYSSHPLALHVAPTGLAHTVFLHTSNALEATVHQASLTYRLTGGLVDVYVTAGPTPAQALAQYAVIVGLPFMPPLWALGFHQSRYGYTGLAEVEHVVQRHEAEGLPLDTVWLDIDYMQAFMDWSWDPVAFPVASVREFVRGLHAKDMHLVTIVDPGIKSVPENPAYQAGLEMDVFIKTTDGANFPGKVWPGDVVFPDFLNPNCTQWWGDAIRGFLALDGNDSIPVDGLWIDMNEISNFCDGPCGLVLNMSLEVLLPVGSMFPNSPPYPINNHGMYLPLHAKTLSMDAMHYGGVLEYNAHNIFGVLQAHQTKKVLEQVRGKRAFVLSRSTFPGSGAHTAHWTGDNDATWAHMAASIPGILNFQLFQIPLVGADICGFGSATTEELCCRWASLGAFYPFSRNHNSLGQPGQEFYVWPSVARVARVYMGARYRLAPYLYTLFFRASAAGALVARPLVVEFPTDTHTHAIDSQFMLGPALLLSPVLTEGAVSARAYFPRGVWYDWLTYEKVQRTSNGEGGGYETIPVPLEAIGVHVRGGAVLCLFTTHSPTLVATWAKADMQLQAFFDGHGEGEGEVYLDDGETLDPRHWALVSFVLARHTLRSSVQTGDTAGYFMGRNITSILLVGHVAPIAWASVNGQPVHIAQSPCGHRITLTGFQEAVTRPLVVEWGEGGRLSTGGLGWGLVGVGGVVLAVLGGTWWRAWSHSAVLK